MSCSCHPNRSQGPWLVWISARPKKGQGKKKKRARQTTVFPPCVKSKKRKEHFFKERKRKTHTQALKKSRSAGISYKRIHLIFDKKNCIYYFTLSEDPRLGLATSTSTSTSDTHTHTKKKTPLLCIKKRLVVSSRNNLLLVSRSQQRG